MYLADQVVSVSKFGQSLLEKRSINSEIISHGVDEMFFAFTPVIQFQKQQQEHSQFRFSSLDVQTTTRKKTKERGRRQTNRWRRSIRSLQRLSTIPGLLLKNGRNLAGLFWRRMT